MVVICRVASLFISRAQRFDAEAEVAARGCDHRDGGPQLSPFDDRFSLQIPGYLVYSVFCSVAARQGIRGPAAVAQCDRSRLLELAFKTALNDVPACRQGICAKPESMTRKRSYPRSPRGPSQIQPTGYRPAKRTF